MNKHVPHVLVLPEDDPNREMAHGFQRDPMLDDRRIQILRVAGGWQKVMDCFEGVHIPEMDRYPSRFMVLLIDFDERNDRLGKVLSVVPGRLKDRVFILGTWSEPEDLPTNLGSLCVTIGLTMSGDGIYETIGLALAKDCRDNTELIWAHALFAHNAAELERLRIHVRPILFPAG